MTHEPRRFIVHLTGGRYICSFRHNRRGAAAISKDALINRPHGSRVRFQIAQQVCRRVRALQITAAARYQRQPLARHRQRVRLRAVLHL